MEKKKVLRREISIAAGHIGFKNPFGFILGECFAGKMELTRRTKQLIIPF